MMSKKIHVTVWNEYRQEHEQPEVAAIYPKGIHGALAEMLGEWADLEVRTATLDEPENGLPQEVLDDTDVLVWWGHRYHNDVAEATVQRVCQRVYEGMGFVVLHSGHASLPFQRLMGTETGKLRWYEDEDPQRLWVVAPGHPIAEGIGEYFEIPHDETYGELFHVPAPDELVFITWYPGGEVFRSGCCWQRGAGKIFYFQPGHETLPVYYQPEVRRVIANAVHWAAPEQRKVQFTYGHVVGVEKQ